MQANIKTPPTKDIDQLVNRAASGDTAAFGELYDIHIDQIYRHIYYRVGNTDDAEDLTQQVFIKAWHAIGRYRKKSVPFIAWLMTISRNLVIDFYRAHKEKISIDTDFKVVSQDPGPERVTEIKSEYGELIETIAQLPEEHRQVIVMRFIEDFDHKKIATVLNKSEGAIRVILYRALKEMQTLIEQKGEHS